MVEAGSYLVPVWFLSGSCLITHSHATNMVYDYLFNFLFRFASLARGAFLQN